MSVLRTSLLGLFVLGCSASREMVVVYSPHGPDVLKDYEARFEAAHPSVDVQALDMGSQEVYNRVISERNHPVADVWWGAPSTMFMQAAKEGLLQPYRPIWADAVEPAFKDANDLWYGTFRSPLAILFNTRKYTRDAVPQTWDGLLDPKWNKKITIRRPLPSGTMRTFIGAMVLRAPNEDEGLAWLRRLHQATESYLESPQLLYDHVKLNDELISVWLMPDVALQRERNGYPFDCVVPPDTPVLTEGIAIINGAPHLDWAEKFYEFVTSPESLAHQAAAYAKIPARNDLDADTLPDWIAKIEIRPMNIDWTLFAEKEKAWCARWEHEVYSAR